MSLCPFCRKVLSATEVTAGVCPKCGNNLPFRRGAADAPATPAGGPVPSVLDEDLGSSIQQLNEALGALGAPAGTPLPPQALPPEKPQHVGGKTIEIGRVAPARTMTPEEIAARMPVVPPPRSFGGGMGPLPTKPAPESTAGDTSKPADTRNNPPAGRTIQIERTPGGGLGPMNPMATLPPLPTLPPGGAKPAAGAGPGIGKTIQIERSPTGGLQPMAPPSAQLPPAGGGIGKPPGAPASPFPAGKTMQMGRDALDALRPGSSNIPTKPPGFQPATGFQPPAGPTAPAAFSGAQTIPGIGPGGIPGSAMPGGTMNVPPEAPSAPTPGGFADPSGRTVAVSDLGMSGFAPGGFPGAAGSALGGPPASSTSPPIVPGARTIVGGTPELGPGSSGFGPMNLAGPGASSPAHSPAGRTVNVGDVDAAIAEGWATVTGGGRPGSTIRGSTRVGFSPTKSHLVVRTRALSDSRWLKGKGPRPSADRLPPEMQPDYELIDVLGEGGMGVVYSARQASIDRTVAIKMLKPDMAQDLSLRAKFLTEAAVTGDLDHPNIVAIHELGSNEAGALFYSMRRVRGTPWLEVIRQKTQIENIDTWQRVADAIAFAHSRGVIHRDLKPENVMLGDFGEVLVMDWGLALSVREQGKADSIYTSDCLAGTPAYMAPEMALGPVSILGVWSDIYLLGAILYEIITGSPPHTGDTATECLYAVGRNLIQPTEKKGELVDIALRAMETDPNLRFPTVLELQSAVRSYQSHSESVALSTRAEDDLERAKKTKSYDDFAQALFGFKEAFSLWDDNSSAMHGVSRAKLAYGEAAFSNGDLDLASSLLDPKDPTHAGPLEKLRLARIERDARQRRLKVITHTVRALVAVFVVTLTVGMYWINSERKAAQIAEGKAVESAEAAKKAEGETKLALIDARDSRDKADKARQDAVKEEQKAKESEAIAKKAKDQSDLDRIAAVKAQEEALARKKEADTAKDTAVTLQKKSEKEAYLALVGLTAEKINENSHGQARELLDSCADKLRQWEWGRLLFECQLHSQALVGPGGPINSVQYWTSKDANYAVTAGSGGAFVWDATPGDDRNPITKTQPLFALDNGDVEVLSVAFAPTKQGRPTKAVTVSVMTEKDPNPVKLWTIDWDAKTAKSEPFGNGMSKHRGQVTNAIFSPEGDQLLTCGEDKTVRLWDLSNGQMLYRFGGHNEAVTSAAFSPPGSRVTRIVTVSLDGSANIWTRNPDPSKRGTAMEWGTPASPPLPPMDGLPATPGVPAEWGSPQIFRGHTGPIYGVAFSPEGDRVITGSSDKTAIVWEPAQEHEFFYEKLLGKLPPPGQLPARRVVLSGHTGAVRSVAFSPDAKSGLVLTASDDNTVRVWSGQDGEVITTVEGDEYRRIGQLRQVPRGNDYIHVAGKLKSTLRGHGNPVRSAAFSADGQFVLSGSFDKEAKIWDLANYIEGKRVLAVTEGRKQGSLMAGAFSVKGDRVITAGSDGDARVWSASTGDKPQVLTEGHDYLVTSVLVSADNQRIVTGAGDGTVRIWNINNGAEVNRFLNTGRSGGAALSRDGSFLITGSAKPRERKPGEAEPAYDENFVAKIWAVETGAVKHVLTGHRAKVSAIALSPDDKWAVTADEDGAIRVWDAASGQFSKALNGHGLRVTALAFSPDGKWLYSASSDNSVIAWSVADGARKYTITLTDGATCLAASNRYLLTGQVDGLVRLWDAQAGVDLKWFLSTGPKNQDKTKLTSITSISFPPEDEKRALVISSDNKVRLLTETDQGFKVLGDKPLELRIQPNLPPNLVWAGAFTRDGEGLVTCGDRDAQVWSISGAKPRFLRRFAPHRQLTSAVFAKKQVVVGQLVNENLAVTAGERTAKLWDTDTGKAIVELIEIHTQKINGVDLSPDNQRIVTVSDDKTAAVWEVKRDKDTATVTRQFTLEHPAKVHSGVFSPKGDLILTACEDRTAIIWDAVTGKKLVVLAGREGHTLAVVHAAFSPDGKWVITASEDTKAKLWELPAHLDGETQAVLKATLSGHSAAVNFATFDPNGSARALTASDDGTAKLWDLEQYSEILTLSGHTDAVSSVHFSPDSSMALTTSHDSTAILWPARDWKNPLARAGSAVPAKPEPRAE